MMKTAYLERQEGATLDNIRADHRNRYDWAKQYLAGKRVLDAGCGVGYGAAILADCDCKVVAIDKDEEAIRYALEHWERPSTAFRLGDITNPTDHIGGEFDAVTAFEIIEHLKDPMPFLQWAAAHAEELYCSVPNQQVVPFDPETCPYYFRHYTMAQFDDLLGRCGWEVVEWFGQEGTESEVKQRFGNHRTIVARAVRKTESKVVEIQPSADIRWAQKEVEGIKVAIVGGAPSSENDAPFDDESWEIWVHGNQMDRHVDHRVSRIFEIHPIDRSRLPYAKWLASFKIPVVVGDEFPIEAENIVRFPFEQARQIFGRDLLSSTSAYMMAYALLRDVGEIGIWGVDMAVDDAEYFHQQPDMREWIGYAKGRGLKVTIPECSPLHGGGYIEGKGERGPVGPFSRQGFESIAALHQRKVDEGQAEIDAIVRRMEAHGGAVQAYRNLARVARSIEAGQKVENLKDVFRLR